ncbi:MAG TPA: ribosome recycling factor [bacterium]|nr:ribosome recycling factor [bacterium]
MHAVLADAKAHMQKAVEAARREFAGVRTGRANASLLDRVMVEYYGVQTPVTQVASVTVPDARLIVIQPWDKSLMREIERAIQKSELGLTPANDGTLIRLPIPTLTGERRRELVKVVHKQAEEARVAIRNIRRDHKEQLERLEKKGELSEDEVHRAVEELQKLTDHHVKEVDNLLAAKEAEITEV